MFTGIIQGQGELTRREAAGAGDARFRFRLAPLWGDLLQGESIAVNGACLTVESFAPDGGWFACYASAETLGATTLGGLRSGGRVNLERALRLGDRLGGHLVSGHVDGVAEVVSVSKAGLSHVARLRFAASLGAGVIPRGSVALDGVSLTVVDCGPDFLSVNVIPETWSATTLAAWRAGVRVNLETDLIGKYVSRLVAPWSGPPVERAARRAGDRAEGGLTLDFLREHGF